MHIGSAGSNFIKWDKISHKSVLISLDGNLKDQKINEKFYKVINENVIISDINGKSNFYITEDPDCSSLLKPKKNLYKNWYASPRFKIKKKVLTKVVEINTFLKKKKIKNIDWFVIDIQGMDLKIIKKLNNKIKKNMAIVNIEPCFEPFYENEDSIIDVFSYMKKFFEFSDMSFGYNYKVGNTNLNFIEKKILFLTNEPSKIYSNIIFINKRKTYRIILMTLVYLIQNNKLLEARDLINNNLKDHKSLMRYKKMIEKDIFLKKIQFVLLAPLFYLKKYLKI